MSKVYLNAYANGDTDGSPGYEENELQLALSAFSVVKGFDPKLLFQPICPLTMRPSSLLCLPISKRVLKQPRGLANEFVTS